MSSPRLRSSLQTLTLWLATGAVAFAQTPTQPPSTSAPAQTPAQRDATRPPGTEQRQNVPEQGRPLPSNPTAPPGTERPAPQAPPGTTAPVSPRVAPPASTSGVPTTDTSAPTSDQTVPTTDATAPGANNNPLNGNLPEPNFPSLQARPVPPLPSQERIGVTSGATLQLTLNEAIRRALASNNDIEVARGDVRYAESLLNVYQAVYDPVFNYTPQINNSVRPVSNTLSGSSGGSTVTTTDINSDFSVNKQFARGGGNYTYFFNNTRETTNSRFTQLNPFYSANQGIQFTQPLFRDRLIDRNRQQIRIQRKRLEQSDADFRRRTIEVIAAVQRAYWELVFSLRDEQNQLANVNLARENFRRTEASVAAGASAPLERAEVQTELSNREAALLLASQSVSFAENNLKQLMLRDPLAPEWSAALMPSDQPTFDETPVSLPDALKEARDNRPELRRLRLQEDINSIDIEYFRNQAKPRIDLQATLSTTALAGTPVVATGTINGTTTGLVNGQLPLISADPALVNANASAFLLSQINDLRSRQGLGAAVVPNVTVNTQTNQVPNNLQGGYGQTLQNLFSFKTRNIVVGATIQIPFRNRAARAQLAGAQILKDQLGASMRSQQQSVEVEVRNAAQSVETARRRVLTAREARRNAELQLAGEQRLYQVGRSTTFLLFQRENQLVNARNQELRAETDYNKALADLQRVTSTTLRANNVIVESPVAP